MGELINQVSAMRPEVLYAVKDRDFEVFATDAAVAMLEASLVAASGPERLPALIAVAWQMRQRDMQRALALVDEAQACLNVCTTLADNVLRCLEARLMLIRGEVMLLCGELEASAVQAGKALSDFAACFDTIGRADAHWLQHLVADRSGMRVLRVAPPICTLRRPPG